MYNSYMYEKKYRKEKDFLGYKFIPEDAYYGIHSERAKENFPVSGNKNHPELIRAIVEIKISSARLFSDRNFFDKRLCKAIIMAGEDILAGKLSDHIVVDVFQAGAGTSLHMNINEVIANRANELLGERKGSYKPVHPNDTVNYAQSTNDVIPTAMRIAVVRLSNELISQIKSLSVSFRKKAKEFENILKSGRTHLSDATPISLGEEFLAYGIALEKDLEEIKRAQKNLYYIGLSGTATGSGINAPDFYRKNIVKYLAKETKLPLKRAESLYESMQNQTDFSHLMGAIKGFCLNLIRISNDLRLMSSGPNTGLNEIRLPEVQAGSSIMPGKINPSILEMLTMVCFYVLGMENTVSLAVQAGQFELNVFLPIIAHGTLTSLEYLTNAIRVTKEKCIDGIIPNREVMKEYAIKSLAIATVFSPKIGYEKTAEIVKEARKTGKNIIDIIKEKGLMSEMELIELIERSART
ncbi:MAG: aspartate ammonia-lyase [Proteobacteria bacterium]|nr:aspartate ammonia-lyase [Pseudomonadota bacterium]